MSSKRTLAALALGLAASTAAVAAPLATQTFTAGPAGFHATSTLITGDKDAVLVDAQFTRSEAHRLTAQIIESGKRLTTIFVTHAHPDHHFGLEVVRQAFPDARVVATAAVVKDIQRLSPAKLKEWKPMYGANLADTFTVPDALDGDALTLEGRRLPVLQLPEGESEVSAVVYVPELKTLVAGDLAFNGVHMWLAEGHPTQWLANIAKVRSTFQIDTVIAGHERPGTTRRDHVLEDDEAYIKAFVSTVQTSATPKDALTRITAAYPEHALPIIADIAVKATFPLLHSSNDPKSSSAPR